MNNKSLAIVTGSLGLVGAAAVRRLDSLGFDVVGIGNDQRGTLFGPEASTAKTRAALQAYCPRYRHHDLDIRNEAAVEAVFKSAGNAIGVVIHAAAQPSHDWAATDPKTDFAINAVATLGLLEACRLHAPEASFLFTSTNKVYGDHPNDLPLVEGDMRFELAESHPFFQNGIDESMSIDHARHSLFGVSKTAADLLVQEYARRFDMHTTVFRAGCLTGADHRGAKDHGFLSYLCRSARDNRTYEVIGHGGKQVRDNLHADDLARGFTQVINGDRKSGTFNIGGGRRASCSVLEALEIAGDILGRPVERQLTDTPRYGDHIWWISDTSAFESEYPGWTPRFTVQELIAEQLTE